MIQVQKLVKRFGLRPILKGLDFQVSSGEFVALLGPNGAGKTTLLRILSSLSRPTMGVVKVAGYYLPQQAAGVRKKLGVLSHQTLLYGDLTAEENLFFFGNLYHVDQLASRVDQVLAQVGLAKRRRDLLRTFSRGMQQRLAIARALIHDPEILLLDEPYTGLDQDAGTMLDELLRTVASAGRTVVMTSHDLTRIVDLATRFDILSRGKIVSSVQSGNIPQGDLLRFYRQAIQPSQTSKAAANG
ncbi:MAG: heme ABC exporter ATP-binding protein CcmA [Chloroflexota bacterium]